MRKVIRWLLLVILIVFLCSCGKSGTTDNAKISIDEDTGSFTKKEIYSAINTVKKDFKGFKGGEMLELSFNYNRYLKDITNYLKENSINDYELKDYIVLYGDFKIDDPGKNSSFAPNSKILGYMWIMKKSNTDKWYVIFKGM
ncbi:hypothetical protein DOK67_0001023 [Enterococcus sp. DIV0212c]|uniref:DUF4829 domain-containing protein n=1 Tax=Candidatus Enterococcus ikei TaxID=2815326 RepID=A0ABS3H158_9ENTE|nr:MULTISPECIES: hypothetical protein [unclassified Enterococcus]MBO0441266.1 hypothetical protein [Enterococcus sp. DIV0869a]MBO1352723.1 hypothetical protein [Enterococcus sp. DIV0212c]